MNFDQAEKYLTRVIPWPQPGDSPAFVNIHNTFVPADGLRPGQHKLPWGGRAVRDLPEAVNYLEFALKNPSTRDIYVCLSTQRHADEKVGKGGYRYFKPVRGQQNAVIIKTLFLDLDFKAYAGEHEAASELARFLKEANLPRPTMMVMSGAGVHIYWTLDRPLTPSEWRPLALALAEATKQHGLKCDTQCTVDVARVLRIPNTQNYKQEVPR